MLTFSYIHVCDFRTAEHDWNAITIVLRNSLTGDTAEVTIPTPAGSYHSGILSRAFVTSPEFKDKICGAARQAWPKMKVSRQDLPRELRLLMQY